MNVVTASAVLHTRIDPGIRQVHNKIHEDKYGRYDQDDALDQRVITLVDGADGKATQAGNGEHLLDHHHAGEHVTKLHPDDRHHRDEGVAQGMPVEQIAVAHALGPGSTDVILIENFKQA